MLAPRRDDDVAPDGGSALLEVIVAMTVFTVLATTSAALLIRSHDLVGRTVKRTIAAGLATEVIEAARTSTALDLTDGRVSSNRTLGGTTFTVTRTTRFAGEGTATSVCRGSGATLAYKLVTAQVSWTERATTHTVRSDTLKAVARSAGPSTSGSLAVLVTDATGARAVPAVVTVTSGSATRTATTDDDGCAVVTGLTPGPWTATATLTGYVGSTSTPATTLGGLVVTAGGLTRGTLRADTPRPVTVALDAADAVVPAGLPIVLTGSHLTTAALPACPATPVAPCVTGIPGSVPTLYPDVYTLRAGLCTNSPQSETTADVRTAVGASATIPVSAVTVVVRTTGGAAVAGRTVTFTRAATSGCPSGETVTAPSVAGGSVVALPYGTWTARATTTPTGTTTVTGTVTADATTGKTPSLTLTVTS